MIHECPHPPRPHVVHAVQIRYVHSTLVRARVFLVVFVDVKPKEDDVVAVEVLENNYAFAPECEFGRVVFEGVPSFHTFADLEFSVHGSDLSDGYGAKIKYRSHLKKALISVLRLHISSISSHHLQHTTHRL